MKGEVTAIVDLSEVPKRGAPPVTNSPWGRLVNDLAPGKAIRVLCKDGAEASKRRASAMYACKSIGIHTRIVPLNGKTALFVWKR